ncbi:RHS repeat-associated protein [Dysgonomonas alginatilytica]|uniref:RHS repeat-associated protein n=1 Tax=Dysgonomonas alginatilytica TaxID=1605892 RepID=A0A2V3PIH0_9BACT|nr:RHS repeat-associated core domain-containing protein [Dysgonomonas alginatilytica]PXV59420.1 RHS repeat-associated protein [Dysgonomonas alginatilytica]
MTYDKQGNIETIKREGLIGGADYGTIDDLTFGYTGNQLKYITDAGPNVALATSADFKDYSKVTTAEYTFNQNGAMTKDLNKGIVSKSGTSQLDGISYNVLNLPREMVINNTEVKAKNYYTYTATGTKLKVVYRYDPNGLMMPLLGTTPEQDGLKPKSMTDYVGNKIYEDGVLKMTLTDNGYYDNLKNTYYFYIKDHLGNNRIVADASGKSVQSNQYYPFGMAFAEGTTTEQGKQEFKYNGKELDRTHGLNWYDYSARQLDNAYGRFTTMDPHSENYYNISPYVYVANNPMRLVDPTGMDVWEIDEMGNIKNRIKDKSQDAFYRVNNEGKRIEGEGTSMTFAYGTIKSQRVQTINVKDAEGNINPEKITIFEVKGDENASNLFNFLINPETNKVEWGHVQVGGAKSDQNLIGTMQKENHSSIGSYALGYEYNIRQSDHNHPGGPTSTSTPSESDVNNAKAISDKFPKASFNIYTLPNTPIPFNKNSDYIKPAYPGAKSGRKQPGKTW